MTHHQRCPSLNPGAQQMLDPLRHQTWSIFGSAQKQTWSNMVKHGLPIKKGSLMMVNDC